jgi:hypothetical protein
VVPDQAEYFGLRVTTASAIKTGEVAAKEPVFVSFQQLFRPEFVGVEDILYALISFAS